MMLRALVILLALAGSARAGGFSAPAGAQSHDMTFETKPGGPLVFRGAISVAPPMKEFGGVSGVVLEGPRKLLAVTDRGDWIRMSLEFEGDRLTGVSEVQTAPMVNWKGVPFPDDAEDITRDPETGRLWVSYESNHRIWAYDAPGGPPVEAIAHSDWETLDLNKGVEALARAPDGSLWAIAEQNFGGRFRIWIKTRDGWKEKTIPARGSFRPTGADFGTDGRLYVTERSFSFLQGFRFRLRRFTWDEGVAPVSEEELLELEPATNIDNIEGVAIWREDGRDYLLIASDDNFFPLERNVLALFEIVK